VFGINNPPKRLMVGVLRRKRRAATTRRRGVGVVKRKSAIFETVYKVNFTILPKR